MWFNLIPKMRTICRILFYDVILALVYISFDIYLAWSYFNAGHKWWGALTLGAIAIPGTLGKFSFNNWGIKMKSNLFSFRISMLFLLVLARRSGRNQVRANQRIFILGSFVWTILVSHQSCNLAHCKDMPGGGELPQVWDNFPFYCVEHTFSAD